MAKTPQSPSSPGDDVPQTRVRVMRDPSFQALDADSARAEVQRVSAAFNDTAMQLTAVRAIARRWMEQHGPACVCDLCHDTRAVLG